MKSAFKSHCKRLYEYVCMFMYMCADATFIFEWHKCKTNSKITGKFQFSSLRAYRYNCCILCASNDKTSPQLQHSYKYKSLNFWFLHFQFKITSEKLYDFSIIPGANTSQMISTVFYWVGWFSYILITCLPNYKDSQFSFYSTKN